MEKQAAQAKAAILAFIKGHGAELPAESSALSDFIDQAIHYLAVSETLESFAAQKAIITGQLVPAEKAAQGEFSFVLEHNLDPAKGPTAPTLQISGTDGNFHALIIKRQNDPLEGYERQQPLQILGRGYQIGLAINRVRSSVDLAAEFPVLHTLKAGCRSEGKPILYFLGSVRQFPNVANSNASAIESRAKAIEAVFSVIGNCLGDNVVIGTGGWAGTQEGSLGVPRISYLHATSAKQRILTTMPHVGAYDRHENPTFEVFCGQEWGDDSATLAAACDAAFVFSPYGTWTRIEVENLLAQKKPFVVIDDPAKRQLSSGEMKREVAVGRGCYSIYADPEDAARDLLQKIGKAELAVSRPSPAATRAQPQTQPT